MNSSPFRLSTPRRLAVALSLGLFAAAPAGAETPAAPSPTPTPAPAIALHGFVSAAYSHHLDAPASGANRLRVFDVDDRSIQLAVAELVALRPVEKPGDAGFRVDLTAGALISKVTAAAGLFRDANGVAEDFDVQQAFVSYIAPVGRGLRLDAGKFVTHAGAELIEGYDGWNDQYSRSFLFGYAIPFTHTGLKATLPVSETVSVMAMVANGWDNVKDNNRKKSFGAQVAWTPATALALYLNYVGGAERSDSSDARHLGDVVLVIRPSDRVAITLNYDFATERNGAGPGRDARWQGVAGSVRVALTKAFALALRGEWFEDRDGVRTGRAQRLKEVTFTPEVRLGDGFVVRGEVRFDRSDRPVFERHNGPSDEQTTLALNVLFGF